jgi:hypothetical protein
MRNNHLFLVPKEGIRVPNPATPGKGLKAEGDWVARGVYWTRRLNDGDVTDMTAEQLAEAEKAQALAARVQAETGDSGATGASSKRNSK